MSTPIKLTRAGKIIGRSEMFDSGAIFMWIVLEIAFPEARRITRDNDGWTVDLPDAIPYCLEHLGWSCIRNPLPTCHFIEDARGMR